jgi:mannonate dehydratase
VRSGSHGPGDVSPLGIAAALHLDLTIANFGIQEYMDHIPPADEVFQAGYHYADGMLHVSDAPGLGVSFDEEAAARYPYQRRYLPVTRLRDGSVHDW